MVDICLAAITRIYEAVNDATSTIPIYTTWTLTFTYCQSLSLTFTNTRTAGDLARNTVLSIKPASPHVTNAWSVHRRPKALTSDGVEGQTEARATRR